MKTKVLDNGYVKLIESWGSGEAGDAEAAIIEAAPQSTQGSFRGWETDEKLLTFMINHSVALTGKDADAWLQALQDFYDKAEAVYQKGLERGIPKEVARIVLPVGRYSRMRATANLRNWLAFLTLRMNPHAQFEIRQFANAVGEIIRQEFPRTWHLFAQTIS